MVLQIFVDSVLLQQASSACVAAVKSLPVLRSQCSYTYFLVFRDQFLLFGDFENRIPLKPVLGGVDSVAPFITVNEQSQSNRDCCFHTSFAIFAAGRSHHQNLFNSVVYKNTRPPNLLQKPNCLTIKYDVV